MGLIPTNSRVLALVAVGGNLPSSFGPVMDTIDAAVQDLAESCGSIEARSRSFQTPCFPAGRGPDFVNLVVALHTAESPETLLAHLHAIEARYGRKRDERWAGRTIDLDLLAYGDAVLPDLDTYEHWRDLPLEIQMTKAPDQLILPHPRIADRGFVLIPLCDILPEWRHPVTGKTAQSMCDDLPESEKHGVKPL